MKLKQLRLSRKLTISKLGQTLGIDSGNLSKIEQGKIKPSIKVLHKSSDFFNISVDELLGKSSYDFITFFRSAAPYIHSYRNKIFVIAFDGFAVDSKEFTNLCTDINLLHALGIKIVIVHGIRPFIDQRLNLGKIDSKFHKNQRITTSSMMPHVIETNGLVRTKIEAALSSNIYHNNIFKSEIKISSGNFLMARPIGVIDGIDMEHTGLIREINHEAILEKLDHNEIVMISPIGYSPIGEIFNLSYESSASMIAAGLKAEKLIFYTENNGLRNIRGEYLSEMTLNKALNLLKHIKHTTNPEYIEKNTIPILEAGIQAINSGLKKTHLINRHVNGSIITELFTNSGQGTVITQEQIENFRQATLFDAKVIEKMIKPLSNNQILIQRSLDMIEKDINHFHILEFDNKIIGCAKISHFNDISEIACFAINENYQNMGYGKKLLMHCENYCRHINQKTFVMTTQSAHWFMENGYQNAQIQDLPSEKQSEYSKERNSKILIKIMEQK